jgi:hypothetical protein
MIGFVVVVVVAAAVGEVAEVSGSVVVKLFAAAAAAAVKLLIGLPPLGYWDYRNYLVDCHQPVAGAVAVKF